MKRTITTIITTLLALSAQADFKLIESDSQINFISVKNNSVGESHHFTKVSGEVLKSGKANLNIHLNSAETGIPIRNDRFDTMLFEVSKFPLAKIQADVDYKYLANLPKGALVEQTLSLTLDLHGHKKTLPTDVSIFKLENNDVVVKSKKPVLLQSADFQLDGGIEKLKEVAGLQSIDTVVPVDFTLKFSQEK